MRYFCKHLLIIITLVFGMMPLAGCSTNPATGESQLSFISSKQEEKMGAKEHQKIVKIFGEVESQRIRRYVSDIGQRLVAHTERPEVRYQFFVLDTPMVNAFALPGGYVYITRGVLALANSEAELAAVIAHEIGHITARHSAERYSQSILASIGTLAVALATDSPDATRAANLGSNLFLKSYSRAQEHQSDELGIRYLNKTKYDGFAMAGFLKSMDATLKLDSMIEGKKKAPVSYFSTHPQTEDRVTRASSVAASYSKGQATENRETYLNIINGMTYGDSEKQGFLLGQTFYHPVMGFSFHIPAGYKLENQPEQIVVASEGGAVIIFDVDVKQELDAYDYIKNKWAKEQALKNIERFKLNGMPAATGEFDGRVNGKPVTIRLIAVEWSENRYFRYQIAIPRGLSSESLDEIKRSTYSLRRLTLDERNTIKPKQIKVITAKNGDTVASVSRRMSVDDYKEQRFRVLNGLGPNATLLAGRRYKFISY